MVSCSSNKDEDKISNPDELYKSANTELSKNEYAAASEKFEQLEREHPTSQYAASAQIRRAYSKYLDNKYEEASLIIEDFVKQYPAHSNTPYMYYLRALCYYDQILDVGRSQDSAITAMGALNEVITRYPESEYARDSKLKVEYIHNVLAGKEMEIGRFYLTKKAKIAALNRFKAVIDKYQTSIFTPEALYRLSEIYYALGDISQSKVYASVLSYNYPDSHWADMANALLGEK
jgi:outer membrane protein assembly factor BamD